MLRTGRLPVATDIMLETISTPAAFAQIAFRLLLAMLLGVAVGVNRELLQKPAGLRTHALVSLGAALLTIVSLSLGTGPPGDAVSRVLQGIIAGVGFIGGGTILRSDDPRGVHGLTTAASIWIVASLGIAAGAGFWRTALLTAGLTLAVLTFGEGVDRWLHRVRKTDGS
jgi:putative Mg2+ transporter-C (MgtC) family protein